MHAPGRGSPTAYGVLFRACLRQADETRNPLSRKFHEKAGSSGKNRPGMTILFFRDG
jgi:hypothetical protein